MVMPKKKRLQGFDSLSGRFLNYTVGVVLPISFFFNLGCGSADGDPGLCKLSCKNAKIGEAISMDVQLESQTTGWICHSSMANTPFSRPALFRFKVTRKADGILTGDNNSVPAPGIAFNLASDGSGFYAPGTSLENGVLTDTGFEPAEYTGIATPKKEWCTDSCGVLTVQAWMYCPQAGAEAGGNLLISSGSLMKSVELTVKTSEEEKTPIAPINLYPGRGQGERSEFQSLLKSTADRLYRSIGFKTWERN